MFSTITSFATTWNAISTGVKCIISYWKHNFLSYFFILMWCAEVPQISFWTGNLVSWPRDTLTKEIQMHFKHDTKYLTFDQRFCLNWKDSSRRATFIAVGETPLKLYQQIFVWGKKGKSSSFIFQCKFSNSDFMVNCHQQFWLCWNKH